MGENGNLYVKGLGGRKTLKGEINISGAKNAILPAMAGAVLFNGAVNYFNVPEIEDVRRLCELMQGMGADIKHIKKNHYIIDARDLSETLLDEEISKRLRASIVLTGPILARFGKVSFPHPGGCVIGERPIDVFLEGFGKMGATVSFEKKSYTLKARGGKLRGADIFFKAQSVTATETFMMAAVLAEGKTVLKNCAMEPEIGHLARFLNSCGALIKGAGSATIEITGVGKLHAGNHGYKTMPDRIEAGSFLILGALCASDLSIRGCVPEHIEAVISLLQKSGADIEIGDDFVRVRNKKKKHVFESFNFKTHEYPGFPTDLQAPAAVFLTQAHGEGRVFETIFENRLSYADDLVAMGADIQILGAHQMSVRGPKKLKGRELYGPDLRAGLAFIIAALVAEGESVIHNVYYVDRGYENIEGKLKSIGAVVDRV